MLEKSQIWKTSEHKMFDHQEFNKGKERQAMLFKTQNYIFATMFQKYFE